MKKEVLITGIYSLIHSLVDLSCGALMSIIIYKILGIQCNVILFLVIYNFLAFAFELPLGIIADRINKNALLSAIGCFNITLAFIVVKYPMLSCILLGIGNSLFHVGGGIDVLNISNKKATLPGIYVSTGAIGLYIGQKLYNIFDSVYFVCPIVMLISGVVLLELYSIIKNKYKINNEIITKKEVDKRKIVITILLVIVVCIRGYMGLALKYEWKNELVFGIISIICVVLGKMLGGIIGDKIGWKKISVLSLGLASVLFVFSWSSPVCGLLAILLFNMTMPLTLTAISNMFPQRKGMSFGLTTLGLFIGSLPIILRIDLGLFNIIGVVSLTIFSMIVLYLTIKKYEEV